jgi:asparagine synthase (glutamine-hydrolysing)
MCGVSGFWASDSPTEAEAKARLRGMTDAIAHRGPDGDGAWVDLPSGVALGHRRLAIIDLSESGRQPMVSASGRFVISFNGEVFNYEQLRSELERAGLAPQWRGHSDTEVMLAAIEAWGLNAALERFIGMFAFALFDLRERTLVLVRDRLGIKPMYFAYTPGGLCFGSELKVLRRFPGFVNEIDRAAVAAYLETYCVPAPGTIYRHAQKLEPGTVAVFRDAKSRPRIEPFWSAADVARRGLDAPFEGDDRAAIDAVDALIRDSVRLRMVSDVPLGAFLSGGVDSSTVVAAMQAQSARPVHTFSIESESAAFDESTASRAVAAHLGTEHTPLRVTADDCRAVIPMLPAMYDEPFADSSQIPTYLVSKLARRNVTVALSGDGGDELFGGYNRHVWGPRVWWVHQHLPRMARQLAAQAMLRVPAATVDQAFNMLAPQAPLVRVPGYKMHKLAAVLALDEPEGIHPTLASHWRPSDGLLLGNPSVEPRRHDDPGIEEVAHRMMYRDLVTYLPNDILTKVDRASMAVSLEARVPLLDHRLVALAWSLPLHMKVRGSTSKWVLRKVLERYVPPSIISGSKMGFGVPMGAWLRGPLKEWAEALLASERLRREGFFSVEVIEERWGQFQRGEKPWEHHFWDVLMFQAWLDANRTV